MVCLLLHIYSRPYRLYEEGFLQAPVLAEARLAEMCERTFSIIAPKCRNALSREGHLVTSQSLFSGLVKTFFFRRAFNIED